MSRQSQIMLSTATSGSDASNAPSPALRRATSETMTMMIAEIAVLTTR
ncbi:MAG: hypothetical protein IPO97_02405 [Sphingomonadales bacterium]|nr:hypothetical protein [Sphingomonadales bacterium]